MPPPDNPKRQRRLPQQFRVFGLEMHDKRLRDILPQPPTPLPPPGIAEGSSSSHLIVEPVTQSETANNTGTTDPSERLRRVLQTARNSFGLLRRYFGKSFPTHDPDNEAGISDLSDIVDAHSKSPVPSSTFGPYPNKSSFWLGDWYWNRGTQKSQHDFKELVSIVAAEDFRPADIRDTSWAKVNDRLAHDDHGSDEEWMDEDAGWKVSPVTISIPFHRHTDNPGPREYAAATLHHRPLAQVIKEKIRHPSNHSRFHYDPYELVWQPKDGEEGVRVYGELYTSPAFIDAHKALQESPREPDCDLPRVVVALMFWSDATQLTNFGNAKLWPLYLFFGNESKYHRCKPSSNCCEHVAYFESVCHCLSQHTLAHSRP
jgi:hypothetical protein